MWLSFKNNAHEDVMHARKTTLYTLTGAVLATSSAAVMAAPNGLFSADALMDSDVTMADSQVQVGEIEDVIFDNSLTIQSFVVETDSAFGLDGKAYLVDPDKLQVQTLTDDDGEPEYRITLDASAEELEGYPEYSDSWWNDAQSQAGDAWEQTRESAQNAWTQIKETTSEIVESGDEATDEAVDESEETADGFDDPSS